LYGNPKGKTANKKSNPRLLNLQLGESIDGDKDMPSIAQSKVKNKSSSRFDSNVENRRI
jgi:hypothetical protein